MERNEDTEQSQKHTKSGVFGIVSVFVGVLVALVFGWVIFPQLLYSKKPQPITFNHKLHVESVGLDCATCHIAGPNGTFSGLPPLATCAECHSSPQGESKEEAKLIEQYIEPNKEIPWLVYNKMPDNVYFNHDIHSAKSCNAKGCHDFSVTDMCAMCHIKVWEMSKEPVVEINKITGYTTNTMKMWECERCHAREGHRDGNTNANNLCFTCHK